MPVLTRRTEFFQIFTSGSARDREIAAKTFQLLLRVQDPYGIYPVRQREGFDWIVDLTDSRRRSVVGAWELFDVLGVEVVK